MAVIGIGTNSRASIEDVLAIVAAAKAMMSDMRKTPSSCPSPQGEKARPNHPLPSEEGRSFFTLSPWGEGRGEGALISAIASLGRPALNVVLQEAARRCGLDLILLTLDELQAAAHLCVTHSEKSMQHYGIPSVAEAAALAAAGAGARLLLPRFCGRNATASVAAVP